MDNKKENENLRKKEKKFHVNFAHRVKNAVYGFHLEYGVWTMLKIGNKHAHSVCMSSRDLELKKGNIIYIYTFMYARLLYVFSVG